MYWLLLSDTLFFTTVVVRYFLLLSFFIFSWFITGLLLLFFIIAIAFPVIILILLLEYLCDYKNCKLSRIYIFKKIFQFLSPLSKNHACSCPALTFLSDTSACIYLHLLACISCFHFFLWINERSTSTKRIAVDPQPCIS